jgi:hypothetical protein
VRRPLRTPTYLILVTAALIIATSSSDKAPPAAWERLIRGSHHRRILAADSFVSRTIFMARTAPRFPLLSAVLIHSWRIGPVVGALSVTRDRGVTMREMQGQGAANRKLSGS